MSTDKVKSKIAKESSLSKDIKYCLYSAGSCNNLRGIHPDIRSKLKFNEDLIFQMVYTKAVKRKVLDKRYKKIRHLRRFFHPGPDYRRAGKVRRKDPDQGGNHFLA